MGLTKTYKDGTTPVVAIIGAGFVRFYYALGCLLLPLMQTVNNALSSLSCRFSGLCAAIRLQTQLDLKTFHVFELEPDLGGTWWSNTYPGAACDVASINCKSSSIAANNMRYSIRMCCANRAAYPMANYRSVLI